MSRISALLLLAAAGCTDPTVNVTVVVPDAPRDYAPLLQTLSISVLATEDLAVSCESIAFGVHDEDLLALAEVTGVTLLRGTDVGEVPITGVPRVGRKLWIAEGRDDDGLRIVAGCTEQGTIDDDAVVTIVTEPTAVITVPLRPADEPVPASLTVTVDDGLGDAPEPLAGRDVTWEVLGPGGDVLSGGPDVTDADGEVEVALAGPGVFGPASIQLRARWGRDLPEVVPAFQMVATTERSINRACTGNLVDTLTVDSGSWNQFRLDDRLAIAGLARDATRTRLYVASWDGAAAADACSGDLAGVGTYAILRGGTADPVDRLLIVTQGQWIEHEVSVAGDDLALTPRTPTAWANPGTTAPVALVTMRACRRDDGDTDYVLAQLDDDTVIALDQDGQQITRPFATQLAAALPGLGGATLRPRIVKSGCIAQGGPLDPPLQALILGFVRIGEGAATLPRYLAIDDAENHYTGLIVPSVGAAAFTNVSVMQPLLLGGAIDPTGTKVVRWQLTAGDDGLELREVAREDSLGPPASLALGLIDDDDDLDTVWGLVDAVPGGAEESRLQLSMGCGAGTVALNSVTPEVESPGAAVFLAPDGDTTSDLVIGGGRYTVFLDTDLPVEAP